MTYNSLNDLFKAICDAIRDSDGTTNLIKHEEIPERISALKNTLQFTNVRYLFSSADRVANMEEILKHVTSVPSISNACASNTTDEFYMGEILGLLLPKMSSKTGAMQNLFSYSSVNCDDLGDQLKGYSNLTGLLQNAKLTGSKPVTFPDLTSCTKLDYLCCNATGSFDLVLNKASKVATAQYAFHGSNVVSIKGTNIVIKGNMQRMCYNCAQLQTFEASLTPTTMLNAFTGCVSLTTLPSIDLSNITADSGMNGGLDTCTKVSTTNFTGTVGKSSVNTKMTLKLPPNLTPNEIEKVFKSFTTVKGTKAENMRTIAIQKSVHALLTADQIKIATDKGYKVGTY